MPKRLFVGGLPFEYTDDDLRALFTGMGIVVSATMVFDPDRNRSRGFGFVELGTSEEGDSAIGRLNGKLIGQKKIFVTEARDKKPAPTNPNAGTSPYKQKLHRKVGRNPLGKADATPPNPYQTHPDKPKNSFGGPDKRSFSSPKNPKGDWGSDKRRKPKDFDSDKRGFWKKFEKKKDR